VLVIEDKNIKATYYYDGSGMFALLYRGKEFLYEDDAKLNDHIKYMETSMEWWKTQIEICKKSLSILKKAKKLAKL